MTGEKSRLSWRANALYITGVLILGLLLNLLVMVSLAAGAGG